MHVGEKQQKFRCALCHKYSYGCDILMNGGHIKVNNIVHSSPMDITHKTKLTRWKAYFKLLLPSFLATCTRVEFYSASLLKAP